MTNDEAQKRAGGLVALATMLSALVTGCSSSKRVESQKISNDTRDPNIAEMCAEIDPTRIRTTIEKLVSFKTRHTLSRTDSPTEGIGASREWIKSEMQRYSETSGGRLRVEFLQQTFDEPKDRVPQPVNVVDVVATLPGAQPESTDRIYIVSGHYDSRALGTNDEASAAPGANDDASGTAAVMEMARVMSSRTFDASIVFVCVAGEEQGLLGAQALADRARKENWNVAAMFTNDIIGNTHGGNGVHDDSRVRVFSEGVPSNESPVQMQARQSVGGENDSPSRQLARYIDEIAQAYTPKFDVTMVYRRDRYGRGGDHIPFLRHGYSAVRFTEPNEDFSRQHQDVTMRNGKPYGDVLEFVDFEYVANVARVNCASLASMALAPASPRGVRVDSTPSYDTELTWSANAEPDVTGYAILVRDTTSPTWTKRIDVGDVVRATVKGMNKDDYMFAVEAYDKDGHRSVPSYPQPIRAGRATTSAATTRAQ